MTKVSRQDGTSVARLRSTYVHVQYDDNGDWVLLAHGGLLPRDQLALRTQRPHVRIVSGAWLKHAVSELAETAKPARLVRIAPPAEAPSSQAARAREATADTHSEPGGRRVARRALSVASDGRPGDRCPRRPASVRPLRSSPDSDASDPAWTRRGRIRGPRPQPRRRGLHDPEQRRTGRAVRRDARTPRS